MGNKALVPRLRFPEFRDQPEWANILLRDVLHEHGAKSDGSSEVHSVSVHKGIVNQVEHLGRSFAASDTGRYNLVRPHDIVYTKSPTGEFPYGIVKQSKLAYPVIVSPLYGVFTPKNQYIGCILDAHFESPLRTNNYLAPITQKGAKNTIQISNATFLSKAIILPGDPLEQRRIAECLTSLDEVIAKEGRKLEALRTFKRGLMQNLFPREGENTPRLRFPEFRNSPEWELRRGGVLFANRIRKGKAGLPIYSVTIHAGMVRRDSFDRDFYDIEDATGNKMACKNDIVYNMMRMWQGALGVAPQDCLVSPAYVVLSPKEGVVSPFFEYLFKLPASLLLLTSHSRGLTKDRLRLYYHDFAATLLRVPLEAEQQRIADYLGSLDALITAQAKRLETLILHKQGLMQGLFPSLEAG